VNFLHPKVRAKRAQKSAKQAQKRANERKKKSAQIEQVF
jgi:hypothetical protein